MLKQAFVFDSFDALPGVPSRSCARISLCYASGKLMLHLWLIPALAILVAVFCGFYLLMRFQGGTGVRGEGRTLMNKPDEDESDLP